MYVCMYIQMYEEIIAYILQTAARFLVGFRVIIVINIVTLIHRLLIVGGKHNGSVNLKK